MEKWDKQHSTRREQTVPSVFLQQLFDRGSRDIKPGKALDIATGKGRNAFFLAEREFRVEGIEVGAGRERDLPCRVVRAEGTLIGILNHG